MILIGGTRETSDMPRRVRALGRTEIETIIERYAFAFIWLAALCNLDHLCVAGQMCICVGMDSAVDDADSRLHVVLLGS